MRLAGLADVLAERPERVAEHFVAGETDDAFATLNIAYGRDGAVVHVADGITVDTPIHIVDLELPDTNNNASCTGVVIHLGAGSSATVVETRIGAGADVGGSNTRTTVTLAEDATLEHVAAAGRAVDPDPPQPHRGRPARRAARSTPDRSTSAARYGRVAYDVRLEGAGARADLSGLFFGTGSQVLDQQINVVHAAEDCTSRQTYRGVLDDESTGVFNGGIDVRPGADGTDAEQANDNLLLSRRAEVNTQPRLEILADEVACKHGATVGQLDDTALYYMRTRGIAADEARRLLINGFADQAVDDVGIETVRAWITHRLGHDDA